MLSNLHSTHRQGGAGGRLNLVAWLKDFGKVKICEVNKIGRMNTPSAGEFILIIQL